ncbi:ABC transporter ATP-binding protein [Candidatus Uhrbacteria bacterium RIFOXYC2_FULL_47_19]|uniref:ABC transporter ATP-binding protein n=1 Tax=Candidatus Uhrbacteria bacterium RIFOXYC2_FULL_47_19 TaxID=1802424 RepID=A0A1F7WC92_9BACT|nr:MAG: ABC transporter ATP-binding protein [Candidatus Uhrbacteria bacterium RIFOXYC2_FULL_47_19]HCC22064.1 ABC transporter ATP-binding protein [Candidatus Uhrbacteria bacterium]
MNVIEVKELKKVYKDKPAVNEISFDVAEGEIFGFLGPNGAGKSTSINILATILPPTSGDATVNGFSIIEDRDSVRKSIGLVFQDPSLDDRLTASENLRFHAKLYGVPKNLFTDRMKEVLELVDLWDRKDDFVRTFSGGMRRRLEIARGLLHYPKILFLDEPTIGLDPQTRAHLWEYVLRLKREKMMTIFMTTHYMDEAEACDRIAIIDHGDIVALDTPEALKKEVGGDIITLKGDKLSDLKIELEHRYGLKVDNSDGSLRIEVENGETFLPKLFNELDVSISSVELRKPTLDDVFLSITGRNIRAETMSGKDRTQEHMRRRGRH